VIEGQLEKDRRSGTILSVALHLMLLAVFVVFFRHPLSTRIVAAGEGRGDGAIEVGLVDAGLLGLSAPRNVTSLGETDQPANNELVETVRPEERAELLPSTKSTRREDEKSIKTDRPTTGRTDQLITREPLRGGSPNTSVEVGRSSGSQRPAMSGGIGVGGGGNLGATGVPGGSEYGRRIQLILSRNYNPPAIADAQATQFVIVRLRIARDGRILSLVNGRLAPNDVRRRSTYDLINFAAERAILASNPLPPFPNDFLLGAREAVAEIWFRYPK